MKVSVRNSKEHLFSCDVLILPLPEGSGLGPYRDFDRRSGSLLSAVIASGEFQGRHGQTVLLHAGGRAKPRRIFLVGLGREAGRDRLRQAGGKAATVLGAVPGIHDIALSSRSVADMGLMPSDFLEGFLLADYRYERYKKEKDKKPFRSLTVLSGDDIRMQVRLAETVSLATHFARDLVNTPSNDMTPSLLVRAARSIRDVSVRVLNRKQVERLGMGAYLSVSRGSTEPLKFIVVTYRKMSTRPVVLIGKSITFDSGGISLKPSQGMEKMKYDMAGGAAVLGVLKASSMMRLPLHLVGILPATENLPGGSAAKPGDVVRSMEGKTIEIITTDAEGRMAIADALGYAKRLAPRAVIDIATLTGACAIALGGEAIAMMGNDKAIMKTMEEASEETSERVWGMPLFEEYAEYIKSDIADLKNSGGKEGSLITSGYFLREFAGEVPWVHLDIAGTAWTEKDRPYIPKGASGVGVRLLFNFLKRLADRGQSSGA